MAVLAAGCGGSDGPAPRGLALDAVPRAERAACLRVAAALAPARCPARLPASSVAGVDPEGTGDFVSSGCGWLRGLAYEDAGDVPVFHVLVGARCAPLALDDLGAVPLDEELRLLGRAALEPGAPRGAPGETIRPRSLGETTVRGERAVLLRWAGFERAGTIHGGHDGVVWNEDGAAWVVSLHFRDAVPDGVRLATLRAVAASMRGA